MTQRVPRISTDTPIGADIDLDDHPARLADGTPLTTERADRLTRDLRKRAGRPSLSATDTQSPQISFRAPVALRDRAIEVAADEGKSLSELAREALQDRVDAH